MMDPDLVAMDDCHLRLIAATAGALKPKNILELGYGSGRLTRFLLETVHKYQMDTKHTLVDNWLDWDGVKPKEVEELEDRIRVYTSPEKEFVQDSIDENETFDLIISDADHHHSHEWFADVIKNLLAPGGFAFFHDVGAQDFQNLAQNVQALEMHAQHHSSLPFRVFDKNSLPGERCDRGLLMVFKR